jgi:acyl carrier protein
MNLNEQIVGIIRTVLHLSTSTTLSLESHLIGAVPEFDSMAVVSIITALENRFGIVVDDDEIDASVFETVGSLVTFVESKL